MLTFWTLAALLTLSVAATVAWPLLRAGAKSVAGHADHDIEVYAAQLAELDADVGRGAIAAGEAGVARAEIGRRLLRSAQRASAGISSERPGARWLGPSALALAFFLPLGGVGLYAHLGSPGVSDLPLAARLGESPGSAQMAEMVAAAEARLSADPGDGRGWDVLAPVYLRSGQTEKAVTAYRNAIELLGERPARLLGLGEALTRAAGGEVTDEARGAFERAAASDPNLLAPRIFLALDLSQEGRFDEAANAWNSIIERSPPDAPWRPMAESALADARAQGGGGPVNELARTAADLPQAEQEAMIAGMVAGLAERLESSPDDAEGWARLIQAYGVLGEEAAAREAFVDARAAFPDDTAEWLLIAETARAAGLADLPEARP